MYQNVLVLYRHASLKRYLHAKYVLVRHGSIETQVYKAVRTSTSLYQYGLP
jgi:hypothetical protein